MNATYLSVVTLLLISFKLVSTRLSCSDTQRAFELQNLGPRSLVPDSASINRNLSICSNTKPSCCTVSMERQYKKAGRINLVLIVESTLAILKSRMKSFYKQFKDIFKLYKEQTQERIESKASGSIPTGYLSLTHLLRSFLKTVVPYRRERKLNIQLQDAASKIIRYFSDLYLLKVEEKIFTDLEKEQKLCVKNQFNNLLQSKKFARKLTKQFIQTLNLTSLYIQSLYSAVQALNVNSKLFITKDCHHVVVRMKYCSHCSMLVEARPCRGYCLNVLSGCLLGVIEIDQYWKSYATSMLKLANQMVAHNNSIHSFFKSFSQETEKILEKEIKKNLIKSIQQTCSIPRQKRRLKKKSKRSSLKNSSVHKVNSSFNLTVLNRDMTEFINFLKQSKNLLSDLPQRLCDSNHFSISSSEQDCWDGDSIKKRYTKPVVDNDFESQQQNPEVKVKGIHPAVQKSIKDLNITYKVLKLKPNDPIYKELLLFSSYTPPLTNKSSASIPSMCDDDEDGCRDAGSGVVIKEDYPITKILNETAEKSPNVATLRSSTSAQPLRTTPTSLPHSSADLISIKTERFIELSTTDPNNSASNMFVNWLKYLIILIQIFLLFF